jgi:hypothetical protein
MGKPENDLRRVVMQYLRLHQVWPLPMKRGRADYTDEYGTRSVTYGTKGMSDLLGILPVTGQACWMELKAGDDTLTPDQYAFLEAMRQQGAGGIEVRELEDVIRWLAGIQR